MAGALRRRACTCWICHQQTVQPDPLPCSHPISSPDYHLRATWLSPLDVFPHVELFRRVAIVTPGRLIYDDRSGRTLPKGFTLIHLKLTRSNQPVSNESVSPAQMLAAGTRSSDVQPVVRVLIWHDHVSQTNHITGEPLALHGGGPT